MKKILAFSILLIIFSCGAGWSDVLNNLGDGYYYLGEGSPSNYIYRSNNINSTSIDRVIIYPNVSCYDYDQDYIVVFQNPNYDEIINIIMSEKRMGPYINQNERKLAEEKADSILESESKYRELFFRDTNYYILSKKDYQVYGPLSKEAYLNKREELKVSEDLVLKEE